MLKDNGNKLEIKIEISLRCGSKSIQLNLVDTKENTRLIGCDGVKVVISEDDEK